MTDRINAAKITERPELAQKLKSALGAMLEGPTRVFIMGECRIIVSDEPEGWHLSISCPRRDPTWDEIVTARYRLLSEVRHMVMLLPAREEYVNVHAHTFHLWEDPRRAALIVPEGMQVVSGG